MNGAKKAVRYRLAFQLQAETNTSIIKGSALVLFTAIARINMNKKIDVSNNTLHFSRQLQACLEVQTFGYGITSS